MTGRGYLIRRLNQLTERNVEEEPTQPQYSHTNGNNLRVPALSNETIIGNHPQVPRGRRGWFERIAAEKLKSSQELTSTFKSIKIDNSKDLVNQTLPGSSVFNNDEKCNSSEDQEQLMTNSQIQSIPIETSILVEKPPLLSRVPNTSEKNNYHMNQRLPGSSICNNDEKRNLSESISEDQEQLMINSQSQSIPIETSTMVDKPPLLSRVPNISEKNNYHMTRLSLNYIKVELDKNISIYEYIVTFDPPIDAKSARYYLLNEQREIFPVKLFDGTILLLPTKLSQNITTLIGKLKDQSEVKITVKYQKEKTNYEFMQFHNILLRSVMKNLGFIEFGRNYFDPKIINVIPNWKIEIWPGYTTKIENLENDIYLSCDIVFRVLRQQTVLEVMKEIIEISKIKKSDFKNNLFSQLCNSTVITRYNNKTYKIDDLDFSMTPLSTFNYNGTDMSYVDYYKKMYNIVIKDLGQPMIITKNKKININKIEQTDICCLVPEICYSSGLTQEMKSNFKLMKDISNATKVTPDMRINSLISLVNRINEDNFASQRLKNWGLSLCSIPVEVDGPVYKQESIVLGNNIRKQVEKNTYWDSYIKNKCMFRAVSILNWAILYMAKDQTTATTFCKQLTISGGSLGMGINSPIHIIVPRCNPEAFVHTINNTVSNNSDLQIIIIIFPNIRDDCYNAVKRICCAEIGIPSQVVLARTLAMPNKFQSVIRNIALQINCKTGGACWAIDIPLKKTIIVGIDTYHDKYKLNPSVVGFVASMDNQFTQWYSIAVIQKSCRAEIMNTINLAFNTVLNKYKEKNGMLPEKIIIYRDGVSYGELEYVEEIEICTLKECFKNFSECYNPNITFIVVQKRINTKIFQFLDQKYSNPDPGTVVDNTITKRNYFDFYLVSQHARQGTVNPSHYIVLTNSCNLSTENVQRLSYKLCHLYYNWCGTIKIPAPIQYAHKLAYLIGENIKQKPNEKLADTLFFL